MIEKTATQIKVLLIEDNSFHRRLIESMLADVQDNPFELKSAELLSTGLGILENEDVDVVLLDLNLPDSVGLETLQKILTRKPDCPVVVYTATDDERVAIEAVKEGAQDYLFKGQVVYSQLLVRSILYAIERKRSIEQLRSLKKAVESMQIGVTITDLDGKIIYTNPSEAKMHGFYVEELIGKESRVFAPQDSWRPMGKDEIHRMESLTRETINTRKDGSQFPVQLTSDIVKNERGQPISIVSSCEDITERKLFEMAIEESQKQYHSLFEDSPISLWVKDFSEATNYIGELREKGISDFRAYFEDNPDDVKRCAGMIKVLDVNKATLSLYGADNKEVFVEGLEAVLCEESHDAIKEELIAMANGETRFECETKNRTFGGEKIDISLKWSTAPGHEVQLSKVFVSIIDITERKKMEAELLRLSITDSLTGLFNQRHFFKKIDEEIRRARRMSYPLCLMMFDVDNFKKYNDTMGHIAGDKVLKYIGEVTSNFIRKDVDSAFRYGGDEFTIILPYADEKQGRLVGERINKSVKKYVKGQKTTLSMDKDTLGISVGIATLSVDMAIEDIINSADKAMYLNKNAPD